VKTPSKAAAKKTVAPASRKIPAPASSGKTPVPAKGKKPATPPSPPAKKASPPAKVVSKAPVKLSAAQPAAKATAKAPAAVAKTSAASKSKVAPAAPAKKSAPASSVKPMTAPMTEAEKAPELSTPAAVEAVVAPDQPVRAARPSARLAQLTVPSLPPAVASTAAKSSFMPSAPAAPVAAPFAPIKKDPKLANNWKTKKVDELKDAEILAMPDDAYMNDMQMAYFRRKLVLLKQDILASAGQTTEHLREDTVVVPDPADRATIEEEHALELRTRDRERKLLKKIEQSIQRIDAGDYGFCDETGEAIGVGRLLARPTATLSLEAQQRRELKQKMFGD
jgi:DnaK suppressor protein